MLLFWFLYFHQFSTGFLPVFILSPVFCISSRQWNALGNVSFFSDSQTEVTVKTAILSVYSWHLKHYQMGIKYVITFLFLGFALTKYVPAKKLLFWYIGGYIVWSNGKGSGGKRRRTVLRKDTESSRHKWASIAHLGCAAAFQRLLVFSPQPIQVE